jgi:hypothetical protein
MRKRENRPTILLKNSREHEHSHLLNITFQISYYTDYYCIVVWIVLYTTLLNKTKQVRKCFQGSSN